MHSLPGDARDKNPWAEGVGLSKVGQIVNLPLHPGALRRAPSPGMNSRAEGKEAPRPRSAPDRVRSPEGGSPGGGRGLLLLSRGLESLAGARAGLKRGMVCCIVGSIRISFRLVSFMQIVSV